MSSNSLTRRLCWLAGSLVVAVGCIGVRPAPARRAGAQGPSPATVAKFPYRTGEMIVHVTDDGAIGDVAGALGARVMQKMYSPHLYILKGGDVPAMLAHAASLPGVVAASPNFLGRWQSLPVVHANDPFAINQWSMRRAHVPEAQRIMVGERDPQGPRPTIIAYLDSGISPTHPDLQNQLPGMNFVPGEDPSNTSDDLGHGTFGAGQAAALTNNGQGIMSPNWEGVMLLPVRVGTAAAPIESAVIDGINFAMAQNADVINLSVGLADDPILHSTISAAYNVGISVVAAAGNDRDEATGTDPGISVPASYPETIAVGATGPDGAVAAYSDTGPELWVVAPGGNDDGPARVPPSPAVVTRNVFSTTFSPGLPTEPGQGDGYGFSETLTEGPPPGAQGTSFATPLVSGVIAALIADHVTDCLPQTADRVNYLKQLLALTATSATKTPANPAGVHTNNYGWGEVNLEAAIKAAREWIDVLTPTAGGTTPNMTEPVLFRIVQPSFPAPALAMTPATLTSVDRSISGGTTDVTASVTPFTLPNGDTAMEFQPDCAATAGTANGPWIGSNSVNVTISATCTDPNSNVLTSGRTLAGDAVINPLGNDVPARSYSFSLVPFRMPGGRHMFSLPYQLMEGSDPLNPCNTINFVFGLGPSLPVFARYLADSGTYAVFNPGGTRQDAEANLLTNTMGVPVKPAGVGFWVRVPEGGTTLQIAGTPILDNFYPVSLQPGWTRSATRSRPQ